MRNFAQQKICELSDQGKLEDLILRLTKFALKQLGQVYWHGSRIKNGDLGWQNEKDLVNDALMEAMSGEHRKSWDPEKGNLFVYLCGIIRSKISHVYESPEHQKVVSEHHDRDKIDSENPQSMLEQREDESSSVIDRINEGEMEEKMIEFYVSLDDDPQLQRICDLALKGYKADEMASELKLPVKEVYNLKKKLKRRIKAFGEKINPL